MSILSHGKEEDAMSKYFAFYAKSDRKAAGLTIEEAAEQLHVSARALSDYERGITLPPDYTAEGMMRLYNSPRLGYIWLRANSIGYRLLPELPKLSLNQAASGLAIAAKKTLDIHFDLLEIAADNVIEPHEEGMHAVGSEVITKYVAHGMHFALAGKEKTTVATGG